MASTVPAKSQPLHNFTLPHLKWNKDGHSGAAHQRRRSIKSPSRSPSMSSASPIRQPPFRDSVSATPPRRQSPLRDSVVVVASPRESLANGEHLGKQSPTPGESSKLYPAREWVKHSPIGGEPARHLPKRDLASESEASGRSKGALVESRRNNSKSLTSNSIKNGVYSTNPERATQKFETKSKGKEVDVAGTKRSKILIKIPCKNNKTEEESPQEEPLKILNADEDDENNEVQEGAKTSNSVDEETKTWNLRPRKPIRRSLNVTGGTVKNNGLAMPEKNKAQSPMSLNNRSGENEGNGGGGEKKEKRKLSISVALSKEEIEEDIFALTGSKPARRPKKRAKNIQKQVDSVFPGLWLVSITADSYKVSENSLKG
ncbi:uncharacterized protein LOC105173283 [Sesamum indicum]|uniref:Uncharacterized protein LOC105173283 n=1 Tax=Sesamum indicum TaxID=4182 RepID=A0A6I9U7J4_SESIN|nr:uncharacterized protein LOC105173283 [Sesamum indicum]